jgi:hypothetical protein
MQRAKAGIFAQLFQCNVLDLDVQRFFPVDVPLILVCEWFFANSAHGINKSLDWKGELLDMCLPLRFGHILPSPLHGCECLLGAELSQIFPIRLCRRALPIDVVKPQFNMNSSINS